MSGQYFLNNIVDFKDSFNSDYICFSDILKYLNVLIATLYVLSFWYVQDNKYIDQFTVVLGLLLSWQTHVALSLANNKKNPFVIIVAYYTVLYYSLRIFTLVLFENSSVFNRFIDDGIPYDVYDFNRMAAFIIIANCFIYLGFYSKQFNGDKYEIEDVSVGAQDVTSNSRILLASGLLVSSVIFNLSGALPYVVDNAPRIFGMMTAFLTGNISLFILGAYLFLFRKYVGRLSMVIFFAALTYYVAVMLIGGSRAIFITISEALLIFFVACGYFRIKKSLFFIILVLIPLVFFVIFNSFVFATSMRFAAQQTEHDSVVSHIIDAYNIQKKIPSIRFYEKITERVGFIDFAVELTAHEKQYEPVLNRTFYAKSFIDNLFTPGFDIFDTPRVSNALSFIYNNRGDPSKKNVIKHYQSDQLTIYGESFVLFGWYALGVLFFCAYLLKHLYLALKSKKIYSVVLSKIILLYFFTRCFNSFGMDWVFIQIVPYIVIGYLFVFILKPGQSESHLAKILKVAPSSADRHA